MSGTKEIPIKSMRILPEAEAFLNSKLVSGHQFPVSSRFICELQMFR
jgi:hypothetical protein